jgi:hypothetical protein
MKCTSQISGMKTEFPNREEDFIAGDERNQIHATLLSMHVMWMREHNRIAENLEQALRSKLEKLDPKERDEIIFQVYSFDTF